MKNTIQKTVIFNPDEVIRINQFLKILRSIDSCKDITFHKLIKLCISYGMEELAPHLQKVIDNSSYDFSEVTL